MVTKARSGGTFTVACPTVTMTGSGLAASCARATAGTDGEGPGRGGPRRGGEGGHGGEAKGAAERGPTDLRLGRRELRSKDRRAVRGARRHIVTFVGQDFSPACNAQG